LGKDVAPTFREICENVGGKIDEKNPDICEFEDWKEFIYLKKVRNGAVLKQDRWLAERELEDTVDLGEYVDELIDKLSKHYPYAEAYSLRSTMHDEILYVFGRDEDEVEQIRRKIDPSGMYSYEGVVYGEG